MGISRLDSISGRTRLYGVSAWKVASCAGRQLSTIDSWFRQWVFSFPQWRNSPQWTRSSSLSRLHDNTLTYHSREDSPGRGISPLQRLPPDNTQHSQQTDVHRTPLEGGSACRRDLYLTNTTLSKTVIRMSPLDERSAHRRDLYLTNTTLSKTVIHMSPLDE